MTITRLLLIFLLSCSSLQEKKPRLPEGSYKRSEWSHWIDRDKDCQNTRQEILIERSKVLPVLDRKGCRVKSGSWDDYYYPEILTRSKDVDLDHLIPLKHAHIAGAALWSREQKENFANDPENLVITNKRYNRQKGAKGIDQWLPIHRNYACKYIKDWAKLKKKYQLTMTKKEQDTISISGCSF
jgi:hypothetical protein